MSQKRHGTTGQCVWLLSVLLVTMVLLLSPAAQPAAAASSGSAEPVYLLNAMYSPDSNAVALAQAAWMGIDAALYHANYTAFGGRPIEIVQPRAGVDQSDIVAVVQAALADYPSLLSVIGPFSDPQLVKVMSSSAIMESPLMFVAPVTESSAVRTWNKNVYFARAEPQLQVVAIAKHIVNTLRVRRTAFMYLSGIGFGETEYARIVEVMTKLSLEAPVLYTAPYVEAGAEMDTTAFNTIADTSPQAVIVWGVPGLQTAAFLAAVLTDPRTSSAYIVTAFALQGTAFEVYYGLAMAGAVTPVAGQLLSSATVFPMTFTESEHLPIFMAQMSKYMKNTGNVNASLWASEAAFVAKYGASYASASGSSSYADAFLYEHPNTAQLMLSGWIAGTLLMQTLMRPAYITSAAAYQAGLFQQNRYLIGGDFVLGDYGGPCDSIAQFLSAVCYCNQGGHAALMEVLSNASWTKVANSGVNYSQNDCYSINTDLSRPINFLTILPTDNSVLARVAEEINTVIPAVVAYTEYTAHPINMGFLDTTQANMRAALSEEVANYRVDVVMGTLTDDIDSGSYLVPSPVLTVPHLVSLTKSYVYLMPTLEQQFYVLYQNLAAVSALTSIGSTVRFVLHGYESAEVANFTTLLQESAATFNYADPTVTSVSALTVSGALADKAINFVVGSTINDVSVIADFLTAHTTAIVVLSFADLSTLYQPLVSAFSSQPTTVQARLISFTNLPLWSDTSAAAHTASPLLATFHAAVSDAADYTPANLQASVVVSFVTSLVADAADGHISALSDLVYRNGIVYVYGMTFGTFNWGCTSAGRTSVCSYVNYGAQSIVMLSMERMLDPTVPALTSASTPSMVYSARRHSGLTAAQRSGVIAGCVIGGVLLIAAVVLLVYCCSDSRENDAAPKDGEEPVTLIFTDIESSTAMWAALPQVMADAIASHHRVIRQLIKKYGCYEVKTIGDSFMIACKDAYSAVQLVSEMQRKLLDYDWGTTEIDSKYREFELANIDTVEGYVPTTARLSEEEYAALWRGLRVRIGVHTGLSDIRYDEVTRGYDYYGDTSNMAARTEAIANGGQVVATETTWWALSYEERAATAHTEFGPQGLRGVPYAVEMYQLNPVAGRKHAALRTEIEAILPEDNATETASNAADALLSTAGTMTGAAGGVAFVITSCFSPYPPVQRVRELQPLLAKWNIGAPPRPRQVSEEDYCQGMINRLAIRIANVARAWQGAAGGLFTGTREHSLMTVGSHHNPLCSSRGSAAVGGAASQLLVDAGGERSAMRESCIGFRNVANGPGERSAYRSERTDTRPASSVRWDDMVMPFNPEDGNAVSTNSISAMGSHSTVDVARSPLELGCRRRLSRAWAEAGPGDDA